MRVSMVYCGKRERFMKLPEDGTILLSFVNTKLRDEYGSLAEFCENAEISCEDLQERLRALGYVYDERANRFI